MTSKKPGPDQVHFTLLENGLDFVWSAVEHLSVATSKRELKYALLHIVSGIELILKERLRREDWRLLFPKPENADAAVYKTGTFKSVDFVQLIERVEGYCYDGNWEAAESLQALRRQRNRFEHFEATESAEAVIASTAEALGVVLDFIREQLSGEDNEFTESEEALLSVIRGKLTSLDAFVQARLKSIAPEVERAYAVLPCPVCRQDALSVDDGVECLFCGYKAEGETAADAYVANVMDVDRFRLEKDGGVWPVSQCPSCDWVACVASGEEGYLCYGCGSTWKIGDLEECGRCGRLRGRDDDAPTICGDCLDDLVSRSD
jgi:hypothetical protein